MSTSSLDSYVPDEADFSELFRVSYSRLCLFARTIVGDGASAEDIVQDCFVKLWERRAIVKWSGSLLAYLYTMVRNACYNFLRDKKCAAELPDQFADDSLFLEQVIESETMVEIYRSILQLPPKCGGILKALYFEGKKIKEVSRELNITESTIRSHKAAALLFLKRSITVLFLLQYFF